MSSDHFGDELDWRIENFQIWLGYYQDYLDEIEKFLGNKAATVQECITSQQSDLQKPRGLTMMLERGYLSTLHDLFPNILRKSFFVTMYTLAEAELKNTCRFVERRNNLALSLNDVYARGGMIDRAKKYLEKLAGVSFPNKDEMENYRKLRNCIVHTQGHLTSSRDDKYLRDTYIPQQPHLEIGPGLYGDEVVLHRGFCEQVIGTVDTFFQQLHARV